MAFNSQQYQYLFSPSGSLPINANGRTTVCCGKGTFLSVNVENGPQITSVVSGYLCNPDVYVNSPLVSGTIFGNI